MCSAESGAALPCEAKRDVELIFFGAVAAVSSKKLSCFLHLPLQRHPSAHPGLGKRNPAGLSRGRLRRPGFVVIVFVWGACGASTCRESWRRTKRRGLAALALQTSLNRLPPFRKSNDPRVQSMVRGSRRGLLMASSSQRSQPSPLPAGDHPGLAVSRGFQPSSDGRPFSSYFFAQDQTRTTST